ncbi:hypothetical protein [Sinosporangium album]|uniref:hypothetical protein n=1 Tax=Sinosporangium album TaxID=504805 RepID=UPI000B84B2E2|nr:hypothetical protein [Sinosporangium album]
MTLDLRETDSRDNVVRWLAAGEDFRFRVRLPGPAVGARISVSTVPSDALDSLRCARASAEPGRAERRDLRPRPALRDTDATGRSAATCALGGVGADEPVEIRLKASGGVREIVVTAHAKAPAKAPGRRWLTRMAKVEVGAGGGAGAAGEAGVRGRSAEPGDRGPTRAHAAAVLAVGKLVDGQGAGSEQPATGQAGGILGGVLGSGGTETPAASGGVATSPEAAGPADMSGGPVGAGKSNGGPKAGESIPRAETEQGTRALPGMSGPVSGAAKPQSPASPYIAGGPVRPGEPGGSAALPRAGAGTPRVSGGSDQAVRGAATTGVRPGARDRGKTTRTGASAALAPAAPLAPVAPVAPMNPVPAAPAPVAGAALPVPAAPPLVLPGEGTSGSGGAAGLSVPAIPPGAVPGGAPGQWAGGAVQLPQAQPGPAVTSPGEEALGAPWPREIAAPAKQVKAAESKPLTGAQGLPIAAGAVAGLLGLLWLQSSIQRRRRLRAFRAAEPGGAA